MPWIIKEFNRIQNQHLIDAATSKRGSPNSLPYQLPVEDWAWFYQEIITHPFVVLIILALGRGTFCLLPVGI